MIDAIIVDDEYYCCTVLETLIKKVLSASGC